MTYEGFLSYWKQNIYLKIWDDIGIDRQEMSIEHKRVVYTDQYYWVNWSINNLKSTSGGLTILMMSVQITYLVY